MKSRSLLKYAVLTNPTEDKNDFETAQVSAYDETFNIHIVIPYGLYSNPPMDSMVACLNMSCQEESRIGFAYNPRKRFKGYKPGEVGVGNPLVDTFLRFKENGDVEVQVKQDFIVNISRNSKVTIEGNADVLVKGNATVDINGNATLNVDGDIEVNASEATVTAENINLNGDVNINGDIVSNGKGDFGGGGAGIARLGDQVKVEVTYGSSAGTHYGEIISASSNYKAN